MSNKEIAQALFVTVKTVEVHLSSVYRKLQLSSRRSLGRSSRTQPARPSSSPDPRPTTTGPGRSAGIGHWRISTGNALFAAFIP